MSPSRKPIVYIISAPSGSGKSTLVNQLLKLVPDLDFSISYTTRPPRGAEKNGKQYHFVPREEFERMIQAGDFLEHANVFGNYYGTARQFLQEAEQKGHDLLLDNGVSIFILAPDFKTLELRLRHRSEDAEEVIQRRLVTARREIENYNAYNYIVINDDLKESVECLKSIVQVERLRRSLSEEERRVVDLADRCRLTSISNRIQPILDSFREPPPSARS
jgi:guanylate kinase